MILILGVTASGKGALAFELARKIGAEIISIDSMKVYRRMDIGTAKPSAMYRRQVKYHLIDVVEPSEPFDVDRFLKLTHSAIQRIKAAGKPIIAVGGTAMYIKALLYGLFEGPGGDRRIREKLKTEIADYGSDRLHRRLGEIDPKAAQRIHPNDQRRIIRALEVFELTGKGISTFQQQFDSEKPLNDWKIIGLRRQKSVENQRINMRVKQMLAAGFVDEVKSLLAEAEPLSKQAECAIGYAEIIEHIKGRLTLDEAVEKIKINTRRLAKGQRTWFKRFGQVDWLDITAEQQPEETPDRAMRLIGDDTT